MLKPKYQLGQDVLYENTKRKVVCIKAPTRTTQEGPKGKRYQISRLDPNGIIAYRLECGQEFIQEHDLQPYKQENII